MTFEIGKTYDCEDGTHRIKIIHLLKGEVFYPLVGVLVLKATQAEVGIVRLSGTGRCNNYAGYTLNPPVTSQFRNVYLPSNCGGGDGMWGAYKSLSDARLGAANNFCAVVEFKWCGDKLVETVIHEAKK